MDTETQSDEPHGTHTTPANTNFDCILQQMGMGVGVGEREEKLKPIHMLQPCDF